MLPGSDQQTDFFELSIRNLSSSENNIDGDTVIMTNIQGMIIRNIEKHKVILGLTSEFEALFVFIYLKALETGKRITLLSKFVKMLFLQQRNTIKTCILHYVGME